MSKFIILLGVVVALLAAALLLLNSRCNDLERRLGFVETKASVLMAGYKTNREMVERTEEKTREAQQAIIRP